jgi:hypothetical protein
MKVPTVKEQWDDFAAAIFCGVPVHPTQRQEMRRAFYAGYFSSLSANRSVVGSPAVSEDEGVVILEAWYKECLAFNEDVKNGKA